MNNTDYKVIVCAAIINNKKEVFIARRKTEKILGGYWEFPGGKLEHGEELEAALKREIREELNLKVRIDELLLVKPYVYPRNAVLILFYLASHATGNLKLIDHDESRFCSIKELKKLKLLPANKEMIKKLEEKLFEKKKHSRS